ncbi:MAG: molybdopterin cofactor-binding domain-containing protein [Bryobacteraceae bacterium]|jgi:isoquinoline 1-oxidoreductase
MSPHEPERYELSAGPVWRFAPDRRELLQLLGGGILIALTLPRAEAFQESGAGRSREGAPEVPQTLGAWLHIDESGSVTVYTGKVEMGQNIRTSLAQAVADELRSPVTSIRMVMGDTDQTPFDMGTFGSMSTPRMAPQLRRAGAAARQLLQELAGKQWETKPDALVVGDGKVTDPATGRSLGFGQLTRGQNLVETIGAPAVTPATEWKIAGQPLAKTNGRDIVTGKHEYPSDIRRPGMLYGKVLRPPAFGATLASVDTKAAEAMPAVTVVHDGDFVGVAAPYQDTARRALAAIRAEWKTAPQPSSKDLVSVLRPGAPVTASAGRTLQATYTVAYIAHTPLEPRAAVAEWSDGKLTVWTGTQRPFGVKQELAQAFHLAGDKVRVIMPDPGSGYGGKHTGETAVEAARLAKAAGKPVKVVWTREEEFTWAYFRPGGVIDVSSAVDKDGILTDWEFHNYNSGNAGIQTPYAVTNRKIEFHESNSPLRQGSYRGLAATANHFAREVHMDELAHAAGVGPLEFRRKNLQNDRLLAALNAAAERFGWGRAKPAGQGRGLACGVEKGGYVATCAEVAAEPGGPVRVLRLVTAFECGAIVNPNGLRNQVEGAVIMGLGGALFEAIEFEDGKILNARLSRYRVPRFGDVPIIETVLLDRKDLPSAGAGETPIVAVAPAISNAVFDATGTRHRSLPMRPS